MPITNFPQGLSSFGMPLIGGGPLSVATTGNVFFVNSVTGRDQKPDGAGQGTTPTQPFKSVNYAITQCTASNGDVIYALPGHTETVLGAGGVTFGKVGVAVIGLGNRNSRPVFSFTGVAGTIAMSSASSVLKNVILKAAIDEVVTAIAVTAAFCTIDSVDVVETSAKQFIQKVLTTAAATDMEVLNCIDHQATASASNSLWIQLVGADRARIENNRIMITTTNSASSSVIESDTTAPVDILILNNWIVQLGGTATIPINLVASTSGYVGYNNVASQKTAIAGSIALASCYGDQNFASHVVNKNGLLEPVVDA
jgi:hypothetical protein